MIHAKNIKKNYPGFQLDLSLELPANRITGLVGVNGSGKTTLFKILTGLTKTESGSIKLFGKALDQLTPQDKAQIGVVLADSFLPGILKISQLPGILAGFYPNVDPEEFKASLLKSGLKLERTIQEYSTGMLAKLKVLCALAHKPRLLILDEPTSGLDVLARQEILDLLYAFMEEEDHAILISSHISKDLENLCDDFIFIDQGHIILQEQIDQLLGSYGVLKAAPAQFEKLDPAHVLAWETTPYGYDVLVNDRQFYLASQPDLIIEAGNIDNLIPLMIRGEKYDRTV